MHLIFISEFPEFSEFSVQWFTFRKSTISGFSEFLPGNCCTHFAKISEFLVERELRVRCLSFRMARWKTNRNNEVSLVPNAPHFSHCTSFQSGSASSELENISCSKTNNSKLKSTIKTKAPIAIIIVYKQVFLISKFCQPQDKRNVCFDS